MIDSVKGGSTGVDPAEVFVVLFRDLPLRVIDFRALFVFPLQRGA